MTMLPAHTSLLSARLSAKLFSSDCRTPSTDYADGLLLGFNYFDTPGAKGEMQM